MEKMWKISLVVILVFLVLPMVVAFEFDNVGDYNSETNTMEIINAFGLGDTIARITLDSPLDVKVMPGEERLVAWYTIENLQEYDGEEVFDVVETLDLKRGNSQIQKNIIFKLKQIDLVEVPNYVRVCNIINTNGTDVNSCSQVQDGIKEVEVVDWEIIKETDLLEVGNYTIGLFTEVEPNERVEWIPTMYGIEIDEWAVWSASFNVGLQSYYDFENNADDVGGERNLSVLDGQITFVAGLIGNAGEFSVTKSMQIDNTINDLQWNFTANTSVNLWVYKTSAVTSTTLFTNFAPWYVYSVIGSSNLAFTGISAPAITTGNGGVAINTWKMLTIVKNDTNVTLYVDGLLNATQPNALVITTTKDVALGDGNAQGVGEGNWVGLMDEMGTWNRSLSASEINDLYNGGAGITYIPGGGSSIIQSYPIDNYVTIDNAIGVGCNFTAGASNISNVTLRVYDSLGNIDYNNNIIGLNTNSYNATWITDYLPADSYNWSCGLMAQDLSTDISSNRTLNVSNYIQNSQTYNTTAFETSTETFLVNVTANASLTAVDLIYDGTSYAATQAGEIWSRAIQIPTITAPVNKSFYWNYTFAGSASSSIITNQTVNQTNLSICGGGGGSTIFLNFSFKDETAGTWINASTDLADFDFWLGDGTVTKNYLFTNTTDNFNYNFCATPNKTITTDLQYKYSKTGYPQRTFAYDDRILTNETTHKTLYLLPSTDGIYSSISVVTSVGAGIEGVLIVLEREIGGILTVIGQGTTGSDGVATFWVNPNYVHQITATKAGYTSVQVSITPSLSLYTITMGTAGGTGEYNSSIDGLSWIAYPGSGSLKPQTNQRFNATIYSIVGLSTIENCRLELLNSSDITQVLSTSTSAATNATYCYVSITYTTSENENLFGRVSVNTDATDGYVILDSDWKWILLDIEVNGWRTLPNFFSELRDLSEFGEGSEAEFNRIVLFFLITTILIGVFMYFSGVELDKPGANMLIIYGIVLVASVGGFLTFQSGSDNISPMVEQFGFVIILTVLLIGFLLNLLRKSMD